MNLDLKPITPPPGTLDRKNYRRAIRQAQGIAETVALQELRNSTRGWKHKPAFTISRPSEDESAVTTDDPVFIYQDRGTRGPYVIRPRRRRWLRFIGRSGVVFAKRVTHPGLKAQKFSERAAARMQRQYQRIMQDEIDKARP